MLGKIANQLRAMNLYYHTCHNLVKGSLFGQDHSTFGSFYEECASDYDAVIERAINKEGDMVAHLPSQLKEIFSIVKDLPCHEVKENKEFFRVALELESSLCSLIQAKIEEGVSSGVEQAIGNIADKSEIRQYKITQRLK